MRLIRSYSLFICAEYGFFVHAETAVSTAADEHTDKSTVALDSGKKHENKVAVKAPVMAEETAAFIVIFVLYRHPATVGANTAVSPDTAYISMETPFL